mgnify:CR=1 FL=1
MTNNTPTIKDIYEAVENLRQEIRSCYVTKDEFTPIKLIAYGLVSTILLGVLGAMMALVVRASS